MLYREPTTRSLPIVRFTPMYKYDKRMQAFVTCTIVEVSGNKKDKIRGFANAWRHADEAHVAL